MIPVPSLSAVQNREKAPCAFHTADKKHDSATSEVEVTTQDFLVIKSVANSSGKIIQTFIRKLSRKDREKKKPIPSSH